MAKSSFEKLFSAELILRRVYLHLQQSERTNAHALFAVAVRHQAIIEEREKLRNERGHNARGRKGKAAD
jgi:hypothetical protein